MSEIRGSAATTTRAIQGRSGGKPPQQRSAVSNGSRLFVVRPGDSAWSRRFADVLDQICCDLGGDLSEGQRQLARRAATICIACERLEGESAAGQPINLELYGKLSDRLGRTFQRLGLKRTSARPMGVLEYFEAKKASSK